MNREKFVHLEFIFLFVVTVDPGVLVGRILVLVVAVFPQHPQPPFLLVLQMFNVKMFKWKQFQHHCNYINATNMPQASILINSSLKAAIVVFFIIIVVDIVAIIIFMKVGCLTNFKELEFFFVLSFTFSFTETI